MGQGVKRFWKTVALAEIEGGRSVLLDERPLKTPARQTLILPAPPLAKAIAEEWSNCGEDIDPRRMPLTGLANAAVDHVAPDPARFAGDLAKYAEGDLLCYRADHPAKLVEAQAKAWDPLLDWARSRFAVDFRVTSGVVHISQPATTVAHLSAELEQASAFALAALSPIVTIGGSLVTALALFERAIDVATAWHAVSVDERWQIDTWGADDEAVAALAGRERDFAAAARFLDLIS